MKWNQFCKVSRTLLSFVTETLAFKGRIDTSLCMTVDSLSPYRPLLSLIDNPNCPQWVSGFVVEIGFPLIVPVYKSKSLTVTM